MLVAVHLINNKSTLLQMMAWRWTVDKPLSNPNRTHLTDEYICRSASMYSIYWTFVAFCLFISVFDALFCFCVVFYDVNVLISLKMQMGEL